MNLLTGSMTPEQFQQYQQEQQQAFFRWQQSQILNRDLDNLQQNPPSFHSESSQTLTQPQQVDSPKKGGRKKTKARRGKNVEDEPQEPVAAGRWLPVEEELLATCYVAVSEDNNVGSADVAPKKWCYRVTTPEALTSPSQHQHLNHPALGSFSLFSWFVYLLSAISVLAY
ncbi:hypothetical protein Tco_0195739 [Tanacetum coccineum]